MLRSLPLILIFVSVSAFVVAQPPCALKNDFTFSRNPCNPFTISFLTNSTGYSSISWDFGDGNTAIGTPTPVNIYSIAGNYVVRMIQIYSSCNDTVLKQITVDFISDNQLILTSDTTICFGSTKQLLTTPSLSFCWNPSTYLNNPNSPNPITSAPQNITYFYSAEAVGANLIINGNFNAGNTGFTSQYNYATPNTTEAEYFVGTNPQAWNPSVSPCPDHTGGNGNMMLVNGAPVSNVKVWTETVPVTPNTNYAFSTWIQAIYNVNPAQLKFSINGNDIGTLITASLPTCTWTQFFSNWNSGNNISATISIVNKNTFVQGNDFALDDISFAPVFIRRDSVKITVEKPIVRTNNDTTVCQGLQVPLIATGAANYSWLPVAGLNNPNIATPLATPNTTTQYIVTGTTANGCVAKDTVIVTINPLPVVATLNDTAICNKSLLTLSTIGANSYSWNPSSFLNDPNIASPIFSGNQSQTYIVTGTGINGCVAKDTVAITVKPLPIVTTITDTLICSNTNLVLTTSGANTYSWSPPAFLSNPGISSPVFSGSLGQTYIVTGTTNGCIAKDTVIIAVNPAPNVRSINDSTVCSNQSLLLTTAGASTYSWSPTQFLNDPTIANPLFSGNQSQTYIVTGTIPNGCSAKDTVNITVIPVPVFNAPPDKSMCFNGSVQLSGNNSAGFQYAWSPATILDNPTSPNPIANPSVTTTLTLLISENACNSSSIFQVVVTVNPLPVIQATKSNDVDCSNDQSQLNAVGGSQYSWSPSATLNNSGIANPIARPIIATQYIVKGTGLLGCSNFDSVTVNVVGGNKSGYFMPSAFTPNHDGLNDCYGIRYWGIIQELDFSIYNRWGQIVFHTTQPGACWDGTLRGAAMDANVYVYMIRANTTCESSVFRKGTFVLIR